MSEPLSSRHKTYFALNSRLAGYDNNQLIALLGAEDKALHGWGTNHRIRLGGHRVFVKRVPVTDLELANPFSTKNLFDLPTYYNYGVGSAGFGIYRELVAHIKTTNWVLSGEIETFPLMYHHRIVPRRAETDAIDEDRHARYVEYWNGNEAIGQYMRDRHAAKHELLIFLEYFPYVVWDWLGKNQKAHAQIIADLSDTIRFLRSKGLIHFDVHFGNVITEGERAYLTDFGLVLDRSFGLNPDEKTFYKQNLDYDYAEMVSGLGWAIYDLYGNLSAAKKRKLLAKYKLDDDLSSGAQLGVFIDNIERLHADGDLPLESGFVESIVRYRPIIRLFREFVGGMQQNPRKDTTFNRAKLRRLLKETGLL
jgi:hypothetical protein